MKKSSTQMMYESFMNNFKPVDEFSVGAMLPMVGSTDGYGTSFSNKNIEEIVDTQNKIVNDNERNGMHMNIYEMLDNFFEDSDSDSGSSASSNSHDNNVDNSISGNITKDSKSMFPDKETRPSNGDKNVIEYAADNIYERLFEKTVDGVPSEMKDIVDCLENKGYMVKYSSPGYVDTRFDNDKNKDGIINGKMSSTARIIFNRNYHFDNTPQGWEWKITGKDTKSLYAKKYTYNPKQGSPEEAIAKWKEYYMSNLHDWVNDLPRVTDDDTDSLPDTNFMRR